MLKKLILIILLAESFLVGKAQIFSLDGEWAFRTDIYNAGEAACWYNPGYDISKWDTLRVPGNWNTRLEYSSYTGVAWYRKTFTLVPDGTKNQFLYFEAVYSNADVWLNGERLGSHDFGFTAFHFDVSGKIRANEPNVLVVRVDNSFKLGATWNWGGIRRSVRIRQLPQSRIENLYVSAKPVNGNKKAVADILAVVHQAAGKTLNLVVKDPSGRCVIKAVRKIQPGEDSLRFSLNIKTPDLWSFDHPVLYTAELSLCEGDLEIHSKADRFGVRSIKVDGYKLRLNGSEIRLMGANYVPYDRFTGNVLPSEVFKRDIDLMKSMGVNMARLSHLALPEDVLDYLDEKGILIFEEIPLWNKNEMVRADAERPKIWLKELICERYNHPCIIGWSAGNEIGRLSDNPGLENYLRSAFQLIKSLDSSRLSVYVTHTAAKQDNEPVLLSDMILFNQYGAHGERAETVHRNYPGKPIFYCEYGTKVNGEDLNNQVIDYRKMLTDMRGREYLIGGAVWTFNDYRSNYKEGTEATQNRAWGVVDAYGTKKRGYTVLQKEYMPLKSIAFELIPDGKGMVNITPRTSLDLPAFEMNGYTVLITVADHNGMMIDSAKILLPRIKPDDKPFSLPFRLKSADAVKIDMVLISPVGYVIYRTEQYRMKPEVPVITHWETSQSQIRVYFDRSPLTEEWKLAYCGPDGDWKETEPTIDHFIQLEKLEYGKTYRLQLIALNNAGQMKAEQLVEVSTSESELPPIIRHLQIQGQNIQIGYSSETGDFAYEFEYGLSAGTLSRRVLTTEAGACNLPVIRENSDHYLRIRKRIRYGFAGSWSKVYKISANNKQIEK